MRNLREAWDYLVTAGNWQGDEGIWHLLVQQLLLSFTALAIAMAIGLTAALWLGHLGRAGFLTVNLTNVGRAVPTFALLAILVSLDHPGTAEFGPYGRAGLATLIALALFALPPIYTNAYVAVREVAPPIKESAVGMGMTGSQRFWRVELPLALPLIVSGLRLALVQVWATATIAALVAGPGLGNLITQGFYRTDYPKGIAAAFVVAVVALVLELGSAGVERAVDPNRKGTVTRTGPTRPRESSGMGA
jgi:osmoprotectant transport system permease protein